MKLIDILVRDLDKFGGWPEGAVECVRYIDEATIDFYDEHGNWPDDCSLTYGAIAKEICVSPNVPCQREIVMYSEYEAALAASKQEWNGEGLPPVGCRVEVKADNFEGDWLVIDVVYVHNGEVVGIVKSENEYLNDRLEKFSSGYNRAEFRPIRSEADKKKEAVLSQIANAIIGDVPDTGMATAAMYAERIYDAIKSGKIVID